MAAVEKKFDDDNIVFHILNGLDEYNPLVEQVVGMTDPISLDELCACLLSIEAYLESHKDVKDLLDGDKQCYTWS